MSIELNLNYKYINKINKLINNINEDYILIKSEEKAMAFLKEINELETKKLNKHLNYNSELLTKHYAFVDSLKNFKSNENDFDEVKKKTNNFLIDMQKELLNSNVKEDNKKEGKTMIKDLIEELNGALRTSNIKDMIEKYESIKFPKDFIEIDELKEFEENIHNLILEEFDPMDIYELKRLLVKGRETILSVYEVEKTDAVGNIIKKEKKEEITKEDLVKFEINENNKEELEKMNEILEIFHTIAKPHVDSSTQPIILSEKEIGVLNVIKKNLGSEEFSKLKIKWNPFVGLLIESKDGLNNDNQKLIMSHTDLVPTFQKSHMEVKEGKRKSALTIGSDGLIRGSLDNTLPNAIVLNNFVKNKFESNVSILFDRGEETGMWGATNFHKSKKTDMWYDVELNIKSLKLGLNQTDAPLFKKDLITINTDVTMPSVANPYTFEVRDFSQNTETKMKDVFPDAYISKYQFDDSTSAVQNDMKAFSYCVSVGTNVFKKDGNFCFGGGCHSDNTATTIENILSYNESFEPLIKALGKEIEIEIEKKPEFKNNIYSGSSVDDYLKYQHIINQYNENYYGDEKDDMPIMVDIPKEDVVFEILRGVLLEVDDGLDEIDGFTSLMLEEFEIEQIAEGLQEYVASITKENISECETKQDILNLIEKNMTDEEFEINQRKIIEFNDEDFEEYDQSVVYEMIGDELYDFAYNVLLENVSSFTEEDFDDFMVLELTPEEESIVIEHLKDKISSIKNLNDIETFNDLIELLSNNVSKEEIEFFINEYQTNTIIEM